MDRKTFVPFSVLDSTADEFSDGFEFSNLEFSDVEFFWFLCIDTEFFSRQPSADFDRQTGFVDDNVDNLQLGRCFLELSVLLTSSVEDIFAFETGLLRDDICSKI